MDQKITCINNVDIEGNPTGGRVTGTGIEITWQDGPLGRGAERKEPNGAFTEGVIKAALQRLAFYQESKFKCPENALAIQSLETALSILNARTSNRELREVEGTHIV